ncbi:MAG: GntR family transcriptional regulator [Kiritimatiellae bacterium]|nr:GntR family transcriptional regulator [Kiritimatiellia bacterium]
MPKKVFEGFVRELVRDIRAHHRPGERYLTVRGIAERFRVSLQTAQKAVKLLSGRGMICSAPKRGITIRSLESRVDVAGKRLAVVSDVHDFRFNEAFCRGVKGAVSAAGVMVDWVDEIPADTRALAFGEFLTALGADGVVALGFKDAALGFYHALCQGVDLVADIALDELPTLPVVQTDNFRHAQEAAFLMAEKGHTDVLVAGYYPSGNRRYEGFCAGAAEKGLTVRYVCLAEASANARLDRFFDSFSERHAVFSQDYATNHVLAPKFLQHRIRVRKANFLVYDCETDHFVYRGLPPVRAVAPSLERIGGRLARKLLGKWETGRYPAPLFEKI